MNRARIAANGKLSDLPQPLFDAAIRSHHSIGLRIELRHLPIERLLKYFADFLYALWRIGKDIKNMLSQELVFAALNSLAIGIVRIHKDEVRIKDHCRIWHTVKYHFVERHIHTAQTMVSLRSVD